MCGGIFLSIWRTFAGQVMGPHELAAHYSEVRLRCIAYCSSLEAGEICCGELPLPGDCDGRLIALAEWPNTDATLGPDFTAAARGF